MKRRIALLLCGYLIFLGWIQISLAATSTTTSISQVISSGSLQVSLATATLSLSAASVSSGTQTVTGTLSAVNVNDARGTAVGWTLSMTSEHFTVVRDPVAANGNTSPLITLSTNNRYDGTCGETSPSTKYTVTIATGGAVGTAQYSVTDGCTGESNQTNVTTTASSNSVGSRGVKVDFPAGTYVAGNNWYSNVDAYIYRGLTLTPRAPTAAASGSDLDGLTTGSTATLSGTGATSSAKTLLTAASGKGMGSYNQDSTLDLMLHANQLAGTYAGTITVNVN